MRGARRPLRRFHIWALLCLAVPHAFAQTLSIDSITEADATALMSGWGNICKARVFSQDGHIVGVIRDRNTLLVRSHGEPIGLVLLDPRYTKSSATYQIDGAPDNDPGATISGQFTISTARHQALPDKARRFEATLALRTKGAALDMPLHVDDACGSHSRLAYGPGWVEKLNRLLAR